MILNKLQIMRWWQEKYKQSIQWLRKTMAYLTNLSKLHSWQWQWFWIQYYYYIWPQYYCRISENWSYVHFKSIKLAWNFTKHELVVRNCPSPVGHIQSFLGILNSAGGLGTTVMPLEAPRNYFSKMVKIPLKCMLDKNSNEMYIRQLKSNCCIKA